MGGRRRTAARLSFPRSRSRSATDSPRSGWPTPTQDAVSPRILEGDAAALKDGVLVERSWSEAIVHQVTDEELAVGAAVIYVPGVRPTEVELRFDRVSSGSDRADRSSQRLGKPTRRRITAVAATTSPETR